MALVPANLQVNFTSNYEGQTRVCYRVVGTTPYTCVNVTCGLGILRNVQCNPHQIIDCVPCDHVVNLVLAASSFAATQPNDKLYVYHSSSG